jgi:hypothetical protein
MPILTTDSLAAKLAPDLQILLLDRKEEIIAMAGNKIERAAMRFAFPSLVKGVPVLLRIAIDLISAEFGKMNVNDLMAFLESRAK